MRYLPVSCRWLHKPGMLRPPHPLYRNPIIPPIALVSYHRRLLPAHGMLTPHLLCSTRFIPYAPPVRCRYKASLIDTLPYSQDLFRVPPHFPTCCLPAGVDVLLHDGVKRTPRLPARTYSVVLTEADGVKLYAACLSFYDEVGQDARHALALMRWRAVPAYV